MRDPGSEAPAKQELPEPVPTSLAIRARVNAGPA